MPIVSKETYSYEIDGITYEVTKHERSHEQGAWTKYGIQPRYSVEGITHPKGAPIMFKSRARMERHVRNVRRHAVLT